MTKRKVIKFIKKLRPSSSVSLLVVGLLVISILVTVEQINKSQDQRSGAQSVVPPSTLGKQFTTLPPGSALPTESECASRVRRSAWEPRPANTQANNRVPTNLNLPNWVSIDSRANTQFKPRITGNFTGTTDEIIQWAACKWGFDEDIVRATAVNESWWRQHSPGDFRSTQVEMDKCIAQGIPLVTVNGTQGCYESFGLLQIKGTVHHNTYPESKDYTAFNVDYVMALKRTCFEGWITWLEQRTPAYTAGDEWGCVGQHYSGGWYDEGANAYILRIRNHLQNRTWEKSTFPEGTVNTPTPPLSGSITAKLPIYTDSLASGWSNTSWGGTALFNQANHVFLGSSAIAYSATTAWGGLSLRNSAGVSTTPYTHLQFSAKAGSSGQNYYVILKNSAGTDLKPAQSLTNYGGQPPAGSWQTYLIDLATLNGANTTVGSVIIQAGTGIPSEIFVDEIAFVKVSTATPTPTLVSPITYTTSASVTPTSTTPGGTVGITARITSSAATTALVDIEIFSPSGVKLHTKGFDNEVFAANTQRSFIVNWFVPTNSAPGTYTVKIGIFTPGWVDLVHWNNSAITFTVNTASVTATNTPTPMAPTATNTPTQTLTPTPIPPTATNTLIPSKLGDLNGDNQVNLTDLSILLSNYNTTNSIGDINKDGRVNIFDLSILLSNYNR